MEKDVVRIVMAGHLDHGKSTLIGRLLLATHSLAKGKLDEIRKISRALGRQTELAYLVDQLKEERRLCRTIETTQVRIKTRKRSYILIDAPGHREFIDNMLTGASMADTAILIIDAQQGIKEQTRRHAYLINLLGIQRVIVALNKMDLIKYKKKRFELLKTKLLKVLQDAQLTPFSIIPVSAKQDENISRASNRMHWYKGPCFLQALDALPSAKKLKNRPLRFGVQDIYEIGNELIVAGKIVSGCLKIGQKVISLPSLKKTRIKSIRVFDKDKKMACSGENIGLTLKNQTGIQRGQVICAQDNYPLPASGFKARVFWLSKEPLRLNKRYTVRLMTQEAGCNAKQIENRMDSNTLKIIERNAAGIGCNEAAEITFKTTEPLVVENASFISELGRFVIERNNDLLGVGIIIGK